MATARPFAYNPGPQIPGTEQVGSLSIGAPISGFTNTPQYWNGPDEELGYVIAQSVSGNTQTTPIIGVDASVGFFRSPQLTENSFVEYTNGLFDQSFSNGASAVVWLNSNGYWTSFTPSPTPTNTSTVTPTPSRTPSPTTTPTNTPTITPTPSRTSSPTNTPTPTSTVTPSPTSGTTLTRAIFTSTGTTTWTAPLTVTSVEYLVVGGGGAGGTARRDTGAGGGGAGMVLSGITTVIPGNTYTVIVGSGGTSTFAGLSTGDPGGNSTFGVITALGGRGGQGDGSFSPTPQRQGGAAQVSNISAPLGGGGGGSQGGTSGGGGGGGGSRLAGTDGTINGRLGGSGGQGTTSTITGVSVIYGVGGDGGYAVGFLPQQGTNAANNTGNGGGASGDGDPPAFMGGRGGSGIVVLKYFL